MASVLTFSLSSSYYTELPTLMSTVGTYLSHGATSGFCSLAEATEIIIGPQQVTFWDTTASGMEASGLV
jgi:hypothetical protein